MFRCVALFLVTLCLVAQPRIGIIDFYGERKINTDRLAKALGVKEGDALPASKLDLEEKLSDVSGVARSHIEATCCDAGKAIIYAGIEERGAPHFEFREVLVGKEIALPAANDVEGLRKAIHEADDASIRADATALIGQQPASQAIVDDLQYAAQDADPTVRRAALKGLARMWMIAPTADSEQKLIVLPTWMIEMLNSVIWTDRVNAVEALMTLTDKEDETVRDKIRERGFDSLVQMARWKHLPHALPPYLLLCRVAGVPKEEAEAAWSSGNREKLITRIVKEKKK